MVPCGTVTASPPSSRACETELSRRVRVSSLDLGVPRGREKLTSREAVSSPDETPRGKHSAGISDFAMITQLCNGGYRLDSVLLTFSLVFFPVCL